MLTTAASSLRPVLRTAPSMACRSMTVLSKESAEEYKKQNYASRMKKLGRPVSPHVTIYAFPIVAISSITNRVTGCALSMGALGLGFAELVGGSGTALWMMQEIGSAGPLVSSTAKFSVAFPCIYHYVAGIRHFAWDEQPEMLSNVDAEKSSYIVFGTSLALSGGLVLL